MSIKTLDEFAWRELQLVNRWYGVNVFLGTIAILFGALLICVKNVDMSGFVSN